MYLAHVSINRETHYIIRQSYIGAGCMKSRDLVDLGTDPTRFIVYPGGRSYYFEPIIEETLREKGLEVSQNDLDTIFFDFLEPETQRVIAGFDRGRKRSRPLSISEVHAEPHIFDKRRLLYLRSGSTNVQHLDRVPQKFFRLLLNKSRDEIEQYFLRAEKNLRAHEKPVYIMTIFDLKSFVPAHGARRPLTEQLDQFFIDRLCHINDDAQYKAGVPAYQGLYEHLIRYAIMYFDGEKRTLPINHAHDYIQEFLNRHRAYVPPPKVRIKMREAERLFEHTWNELQGMDRSALSRIYRRMALKHHPDHGGDSARFQRLTAYYRALLAKK